MRGLCWPDGVQMLNQCSRVQQSPAPVVVVPYRLPAVGTVGPSWPIRTLSEVVNLEGSSLVVDMATLSTAVGAFGSSAALGTKPPRQCATVYVQISRNAGVGAGRGPVFAIHADDAHKVRQSVSDHRQDFAQLSQFRKDAKVEF
jgi:hypothetical protein